MPGDSDSNQERVPYSLREEWKDVEPIFVQDGPDSICPISYLEEFKDTMSYLRAVMKNREISERAFELVGDSIRIHPANYSAWLYRMELFWALEKDVIEELDWISDIASENPKNYQLWHQRQQIIEALFKLGKIEEFGPTDYSAILEESIKVSQAANTKLPEAASKRLGEESLDYAKLLSVENFNNKLIKSEIHFLNEQIDFDSKNFHAWSYRQFVVKTFNLFEYEYLYTKLKIEQDIRNNSAWNQLYFVLKNYFLLNEKSTPELNGAINPNIQSNCDVSTLLIQHIEFATSKIYLAPNNESSWVFIQGLLRLHGPELLYTDLHSKIAQILSLNDKKSEYLSQSRFYWEYLAKYYLHKRDSLTSDISNPRFLDYNNKAKDSYEKLANSLDPIRKNYWNYLLNKTVLL
ncbi:Protein farnesyltransferase/geranylgeranyltransferase type-1 subunit alpha [Smittium culicis]|uniref:Protein farnesyltransferase/geranylgeranyltransferase type-1 subunit alpha n=1 Tax=Smittium culicis TaxID=133412 RepID=A0A1R1YHV5_9FUNG|nr:Protein farnesyltransferase/geranylgeranyltransferase type-1 subunit alpha [Smittium culicis]